MKTGYKQTEVGVIPEDWGTSTIAEIATVKTGPFGTLLKASEYTKGEGVPLISVGEVREGYLRINEETPRVCSVVTRRLPQYVLQEGDIVFGRKGGVDRSALIKPEQNGWFLGSDGLAIRPKGRICNAFLGAQFQTSRVKDWLLQNAIGTTMPSLNQGILGGVAICLPPTLAEQEAIAGALSDADALIDSLEQLIAKKRLLKQGAMQDLLTGKKRLPGFEGEWEVKTLSDIGRCYRGVSYNPDADLSPHETGSTVRLLRANNIQESQLELVDMQFVTQQRVSPDQYLRKSDILICMANGSKRLVGKAAQCPDLPAGAYTFGAFMGCFRPNPDAGDQQFVASIFYTDAYRQHIDLLLAGSSINNLTPKSVESLEISVPVDKAEQTAIAAILSDIDAEIAALEAKLAKARQVKQGMMQELLTGRVRFVNGEGKMENGECREENGECREEKGECWEGEGE